MCFCVCVFFCVERECKREGERGKEREGLGLGLKFIPRHTHVQT